MRDARLNRRVLRAMAAVVIAPGVLASCNDGPSGGVACTDIAVTGLVVVVPGGSAMLRINTPIKGTLTDGSYNEQLQVTADPSGQDPALLFGAIERPGNYSVLVQIRGYQDFRKQNVEVKLRKDGCHVEPVTITATLTPSA